MTFRADAAHRRHASPCRVALDSTPEGHPRLSRCPVCVTGKSPPLVPRTMAPVAGGLGLGIVEIKFMFVRQLVLLSARLLSAEAPTA